MKEMGAINRRSTTGSSDAYSGVLFWARRRALDAGSATAEYAVATLAACGFAGLLLAILRSSEMKSLLFSIIKKAMAVG